MQADYLDKARSGTAEYTYGGIIMMRLRKICMPLLVLAVLLLTVSIPAAAGAKDPDFWISPDGSLTADAITYTKADNGKFYLMLPDCLDTSKMCFGVGEGVRFTFGGKSISTGDSAKALKSGDFKIKINKKSITLHVLVGSPNLPAVYVTTESGKLDRIESLKVNREKGYLVFVGPDGEIQYDGELDHFKMRGNASTLFPKKGYLFKLKTGTNLMGMGKAKKWVLTSNYRDKTHLRNRIIFDLADAIGLQYTPERCAAELYINHEYRGLYLFSEKVEIDDDRVDIPNLEKATEQLNDKPLSSYKVVGKKKTTKGYFKAYDIPNNPADITGGYLMEYEAFPDRYRNQSTAYTTKRNKVLQMKEPEYASREQMEFITALMQAFENAVYSADGRDPETGKHYTELADVDSLALKYMIEEFSENYDGNTSSQYFYKPADSVSEKFFAGPAWDYDSSFGTHAARYNYKDVLNPACLWIAEKDRDTAWYPAVWKQADFREKVASLWNERMKQCVEVLLGIRSNKDVPGAENLMTVDQYAETIRASVVMDRIRWPRMNSPSASSYSWTGASFDDNLTYLKDFMEKRYEFLNQTWKSEE